MKNENLKMLAVNNVKIKSLLIWKPVHVLCKMVKRQTDKFSSELVY